MKTFKPLFVICLLAGLSATWSSNASAAEGRFYLGFAAIIEDQDIRYRKSTYRKANFARGIGDHGHGDSDKNVHGLGAVIGYRWPLSGDRVWGWDQFIFLCVFLPDQALLHCMQTRSYSRTNLRMRSSWRLPTLPPLLVRPNVLHTFLC